MQGTPQPTGKRVDICVNDINVNEIIESMVSCYPSAIIAAYKPNIRADGEAF